MAITLGEQRAPGAPVVKRTAIGQVFNGAVFNIERRNRQRRTEDGVMVPVLRADGNPKQELVVHCLVMEDTTAPAGIGDEVGIPEVGERVRLILKGKAYADWIQAEKELGRQLQVGDFVRQVTTSAQAYDAHGAPKGKLITTQAEVDALPRSTSVGIYGDLKLSQGSGEWVTKAEAAYRAATATPLNGHHDAADQASDEPW